MGQVSNGLPNLFIFEIRGLGSARWTGISELHTGGPASNRKSLWPAISSSSPVNRQDDRVHSNELRGWCFSESDVAFLFKKWMFHVLGKRCCSVSRPFEIWNYQAMISFFFFFVLLENFVSVASNERHTLDNIHICCWTNLYLCTCSSQWGRWITRLQYLSEAFFGQFWILYKITRIFTIHWQSNERRNNSRCNNSDNFISSNNSYQRYLFDFLMTQQRIIDHSVPTQP